MNQSPAMKLIVAIVQDYDCDRLLKAISAENLRATRVASTGGFLRMGNTTVIMGVPEDQVALCLSILERSCRRRVNAPPPELVESLGLMSAGAISDIQIGGAVIFSVRVTRFVRIEAESPLS